MALYRWVNSYMKALHKVVARLMAAFRHWRRLSQALCVVQAILNGSQIAAHEENIRMLSQQIRWTLTLSSPAPQKQTVVRFPSLNPATSFNCR